MKTKKIAILTSGGDSQGMNTTIAIVTRLCLARKIKLYGVIGGYKGLYEKNFVPMTLDMVRNIESLGGSIIKTSRFLDFQKKKVLSVCAKNIKEEEFDCLIVLGGDGSFRGAKQLSLLGVKAICIPATVDNDLRYTERSLGFDTAVNNASKYMLSVKQSMQALDRGIVFEVMGRYCGDRALYSASSTACDILAVPEKKITEEEIISKAKSCIEKGRNPTIVVAEKLFDVENLSHRLSTVTGKEFKYSIVGYIQRGGEPTVADRTLAMQFAVKAVDMIGHSVYNKAVGIKGREVFSTSLDKALCAEYNFNDELFDLFTSLNEDF